MVEKGESRMRMRKATYYAIQIMLGLGKEERQTIPEMEKILHVKASYIRIIMRTLKDEGLVYATSGYGGGYMLNKGANAITLWDIVCIMERDSDINCCLRDKENCSRIETGKCYVRTLYCELQKDLEEQLSRYSIQELLRKSENMNAKHTGLSS